MSWHPVTFPPDQPLGQLSPQPWLTAPATRTVIAALQAGGAQVRFVGGCVRDGLLNRAVRDVDIATADPPERVMELLRTAGIRAIPTGIEHGTVTAVVGNESFQITTLRRDEQTDGRHATVAFTDDWREDAARRDFTINAMSADEQGRVWDPFDGIADLSIGGVRFIGKAEARVTEDWLRILRFFRFHAYYGRGPLDEPALTACRKFAPRLAELSSERIAYEVMRLLEAPDPTPVLLVMRAEKILEPILPELQAMDRMKLLVWLESRALVRPSVRPDPLRRLAAMVPPDLTAQVGAKLRLSNAQIDRLDGIGRLWPQMSNAMDGGALRRLLHRWGAERVVDALLVAWSEERRVSGRSTSAESARWTALLDLAEAWQPVDFPLRGQDALDLGIKPGPALGKVLAQVEAWWEAHDYQPDRAACLERLRGVTSDPPNASSPGDDAKGG